MRWPGRSSKSRRQVEAAPHIADAFRKVHIERGLNILLRLDRVDGDSANHSHRSADVFDSVVLTVAPALFLQNLLVSGSVVRAYLRG